MSDRTRTAIAFGVIIGILLVWTFLSRPAQRNIAPEPAVEDTAVREGIKEPEAIRAEAATPEREDLFTFDGRRVTVVLSSHGGSVKSFRLKEYDIDIVPEGHYLFFTPAEDSAGNGVEPSCTVDGDSAVFSFRHGNASLVKTYRFDEDHGFSLRVTAGNKAQTLSLEAGLGITEKANPGDDMRHFGVYVRNEKVVNITKKIKDSFAQGGGLKWFALRTKYFMLTVDNNSGIDNVWFSRVPAEARTEGASTASFGCYSMGGAKIRYGALIEADHDLDVTVRLMPMDRKTLAQYGNGYEEIHSAGFWGPISRAIMAVLNVMYSLLRNYGLVIMIFALLIKLIFFPLSRQMILSQHKMQLLQPELKKIQQKFKDDPQRVNQEMMHLYRTYKVNPLSGCLPLLIQMPIFFALFQTLTTSLEFRQAHFAFWITDLSAKDPYYVLPISMGVMMLIQSLTTTIDPRQRLMVIFMPILMVWIFINLPSGLQLYWFTYNILTLVEHFVTKRGGMK